MEVQRNEPPDRGFPKELEIYDKNGIVLIFDKCTSGLEKLLEASFSNV